jgi:hypothetical protein
MVAPQSSIEEALARLYPDPFAPRPGEAVVDPGAFPELSRELEEEELSGQLRPVMERLDSLQASVDLVNARMGRLELALAALLERLGRRQG